MPENRFDLIIIGGGIVGLAAAMDARKRFPRLRLLLVEKEDRVAAHQSGRNSGVIHSGLYYRPGSLKAKLCVDGAARMVAFCQQHGIPLKLCGKVVVATNEQELPALEELHRRGAANGVRGLAVIGREQLDEIEPHSAGIKALHVPGTGITDYAAVTKRFAQIVVANGGVVRTGTEVIGIRRSAKETIVETIQGSFSTRYLINCAGLHSDRIARMAGARPNLIIVPFRGEYYEISPERQHWVKGLIYPVPDPKFPFLGVHFTRKVHGDVEAGPNAVLAFQREGYRKSDFGLRDTMGTLRYPGFWRMAKKYWRTGLGEFYRSVSRKAFARSLRRLVPELDEADLKPGGAGIRAQALDRAGVLVDDFRFFRSEGMIHVCNVPSPAATASLGLGERIVGILAETFGVQS